MPVRTLQSAVAAVYKRQRRAFRLVSAVNRLAARSVLECLFWVREPSMSGPMRWVMFFAVVVLAGAAVTALWAGLSADLLKAVVSFAVVALAAVALYALSGKR